MLKLNHDFSMSELQIVLLIIGFGVIVAVYGYGYGWWLQRLYRHQFAEAFRSTHPDVLNQRDASPLLSVAVCGVNLYIASNNGGAVLTIRWAGLAVQNAEFQMCKDNLRCSIRAHSCSAPLRGSRNTDKCALLNRSAT